MRIAQIFTVFLSFPFLRIAPGRTVDRTTRQITREELTDTPMLQDGLHPAQVEVQAVLSRGWVLVIYRCGVWYGFGRWRPVYGCVQGSVQPCYVRVFKPVEWMDE
jgi:hypothetical protein